jgi:3-hydroxyisobutyrate dehydrogenase-like beta-hydroxyacid dehydrogenase
MAEIAFVGLGAMGAPMAGHLSAAGHGVRVANRTHAKAEAWAEAHGGRAFATVAEAAEGADWVIACVGTDADVRATFAAAEGALSAGAIFIDHTTTSAVLAQDLAIKAQAMGSAFLDAPVSGGQAGAQAGKLTVMIGGESSAIERARPILSAYAKAMTIIGPAGSGQLAKMVNQICIAGVVQGLSEGLHFAQASGLDIERVVAAISQGAAQSWQMDNRWRTMAQGQFDFGFAVDWMRKDLGLVLEEGRRNGAQTPLAALVDQFYAQVQAAGGGRLDTSSLITRLKTR